jgi:acyl-CoA thioesterase FadM
MAWIETYRGTVFRWEVDNVDHFTVAYYFARFADAGLRVLQATGLDPAALAGSGRLCVTTDCYVRYRRELRVGDILHVESGVIAVEPDGLLVGHRLIDSGTDTLCTTVEHRLTQVDAATRAPVALEAAPRRAAEALQVAWDEPARERRPPPRGTEGFRVTARDTVAPSEIDVFGQMSLAHHIHRFSAANGHAIAGFGMTPAYQREQGRGFSTFEFQLTFPGVLRAGDPVTVASAILHVGNSSLRVFHRMTCDRTGALVATNDQLGVHLDMAARRPSPLPDALRDRAKALLGPTAGR